MQNEYSQDKTSTCPSWVGLLHSSAVVGYNVTGWLQCLDTHYGNFYATNVLDVVQQAGINLEIAFNHLVHTKAAGYLATAHCPA